MEGGLEVFEVEMGDEEVGDGRGEDDDFGGNFVWGRLGPEEEVEEIRD